MFTVDKNLKTPLYSQIADLLEAQIASGELRENERLPSERAMCDATGASRDTVERAYRELMRRGCIQTVRGSGSYVKKRDRERQRRAAESIARKAVEQLRDAGLTRHETELAFLELMWGRLPEAEKLRVAWVDCSAEILNDTAMELEKNCNVRVAPFLLEDVQAFPGQLLRGNYDVIATTINHFDDLLRAFPEQLGRLPENGVEKMVLTISRMTVSQLAKITDDMEIVMVYESEWYRSNTERFLDEFSVCGRRRQIRLGDAMEFLGRSRRKMAVILPQDFGFFQGLVGRLYQYCVEKGIFCIVIQQVMDNGSLLHFRRRLHERWIEETGKR